MTPSPRILILDHNEDVLLRLEHLLETAGFDTTLSWRTDEAARLLSRHEYDLLIVGDHPPEIDVAEFLSKFESKCPPVVVMQGKARYPFGDAYFCSLGGHAVLGTWTSADLADRIRDLLPPRQPAACNA